MKRTTASQSRSVPRAFYDPAIREVIAEGKLGAMRRVLAQARVVLKAQGDLAGAVKRLEKAIAKRTRE